MNLVHPDGLDALELAVRQPPLDKPLHRAIDALPTGLEGARRLAPRRPPRLFDGKDYFTIYDFVKAHHHFADPEWDGEPIEPEPPISPIPPIRPRLPLPEPGDGPVTEPAEGRQKIKVRLADGKERAIQHMMMTTFWHPDGTPMSAQQFMELLFGKLPDFFHNEDELRMLWSTPDTRAKLLQGLAEKGFGHDILAEMQKIIDAEKSDLFDVLAHVAYARPPLTREVRAANAKVYINSQFNTKQQLFLDFVLSHYVTVADLGRPEEIGKVFAGFQKYLYQKWRAS